MPRSPNMDDRCCKQARSVGYSCPVVHAEATPRGAFRRFNMTDESAAPASGGGERASEKWWSLTRFSGQFTCRHHAASAAAAGLLSYSTGLRSPIEV